MLGEGRHPGVSTSAELTARRYWQVALEAAEALLPDMRTVPGTSAKYFMEPFRNIPEANNHQAAFGSLLVTLHGLSGEDRFMNAARALAEFWLLQVEEEPSGAWSWPYQPLKPANDLTWKAAYTIQFPLHAYERGALFSDEELEALATTFRSNVHLGYGNLNMFTTLRKTRHYTGLSKWVEVQNPALSMWIRLAPVDPLIMNMIEHLVATRTDLFPNGWLTNPGLVWAYAYRLLYYRQLNLGYEAQLSVEMAPESLAPLLTLGGKDRRGSEEAYRRDENLSRRFVASRVSPSAREAFETWLDGVR